MYYKIISNVYESLVGPIKGQKLGNKARVAQALKLTTLRSGNWDEIRNKGMEPALGPRGALNQDERIRYAGSPARYDHSAATLPNYKNSGRRYGATGPLYIPTID